MYHERPKHIAGMDGQMHAKVSVSMAKHCFARKWGLVNCKKILLEIGQNVPDCWIYCQIKIVKIAMAMVAMLCPASMDGHLGFGWISSIIL